MKKKIKEEIQSDRSKWLLRFRIILVIVPFIIYGKTIGFSWALDDNTFIVQNSLVTQGISNAVNIFTSSSLGGNAGATSNLPYRPVTVLSFALDHTLFSGPSGYHFINILLYVILLQVMLTVVTRLFPAVHPLYAGITILLFGSHPIHTEVIANIKSRDEILAALFGFLAWLRLLPRENNSVVLPSRYVSSGFLFLLAILSKESAITFLAIIPLSLWMFKSNDFRKTVFALLPFAVATIVFLLARYKVNEGVTGTPVMQELDNVLFGAKTFSEHTATRSAILFEYARLLFFPYPLRYEYSFNEFPLVGWNSLYAIGGVLTYIGLFAVVLWTFKKQPIMSFGILFFLIALSPTSNIFFINSATLSDRFLFTPSFGFALSLCYGLILLTGSDPSKNIPKANRKFLMLTTLLVVGFSFITIAEAGYWKSNTTLFERGVVTSPNSSRVHYNMGSEYLAQAKQASTPEQSFRLAEKARTEYLRSISIYPDNFIANANLGVVYDMMNNNDSSAYYFKHSLELNSDQPAIRTNLSIVLWKKGYSLETTGYSAKAFDCYLDSYSVDSTNSWTLNSLALYYANKQKYDSSLFYFSKAVSKESVDQAILDNASRIAYLAGQFDRSIIYANRHITLFGNSKKMNAVLADCYRAKGDAEKANYYLTQASAMDK